MTRTQYATNDAAFAAAADKNLNAAAMTLVAAFGKARNFERLEVSDVTPELHKAAERYADTYRGTFSFLQEMSATMYRFRRLSVGQAKGVLNCMMAEGRRIAADIERADREAKREAAPTATETVVQGEQPVADGYYTVVMPDGSHVTLRVRAAKSGKYQNVAYLMGSDNTSDYMTLGGLYGTSFRFWRTTTDASGYEQPINPASYARQREALGVLIAAPTETRDEANKAFAMQSGNCYKCNRLLTVPESIESGIGPDCAKKLAR